jgi:hypothetical protein
MADERWDTSGEEWEAIVSSQQLTSLVLSNFGCFINAQRATKELHFANGNCIKIFRFVFGFVLNATMTQYEFSRKTLICWFSMNQWCVYLPMVG